MKLAFILFRLKNQLGSFFTPKQIAENSADLFLKPRRGGIKSWEQQAEESGDRLKLNDDISAIKWTPAKPNGQRVLMAHGWESRATQLYGLVPNLLELGYEVTALDMPGHGHSNGETSNAWLFTNTLLLAQEQLGEFDVVIAHSMGAGATSYALKRGLTPKKLILISAPSSVERVLKHFSSLVGIRGKAVRQFITSIEARVGVPVDELDAVLETHQYSMPTLLLHDEDDQEVPYEESQRMLLAFKHGQLISTQGLGHRAILKSDIVKDNMMKFLNPNPA
jgi:pimeloyl-ACP methyl ester carboxylesterase